MPVFAPVRPCIRDLVTIRDALFRIDAPLYPGFCRFPCRLLFRIAGDIPPTVPAVRGHADPRWRPYRPPVKDQAGLARANSLKLTFI